ncbi:MAG: SIMPL domain-containing protein [Treponemataceae bacterium]|nr:MAG: SIMPL domain-containing protein [Treponemataceae bacterium]
MAVWPSQGKFRIAGWLIPPIEKICVLCYTVAMKNRFIAFAVCAAFVLAASSCSLKKINAVERAVTVTGSGNVSVTADTASIVLSVITANWDATLASSDNAQKMTEVQAAVTAIAGVTKDAITTSGYAIGRESYYSEGVMRQGRYQVTNRINITLGDITVAGSVIDKAIAAGANELTSLTFSSSDTQTAYTEARVLAMEQALSNARLLATQAGARLGKVLTIEESGRTIPLRKLMSDNYAEADAVTFRAPTPIQAGAESVTVTVNVSYELQ